MRGAAKLLMATQGGPAEDVELVPLEVTSEGDGSDSLALVMMVFRNVDQTTPFDAAPVDVNNGASGDPDPPSIVTVTNGAVVVGLGGIDDDVISSVTHSTFSGVTFQNATASNGNNACAMAGYLERPTAGAFNPDAFNTSGDDQWSAATIALRPASGKSIQFVGSSQAVSADVLIEVPWPEGSMVGDIGVFVTASDTGNSEVFGNHDFVDNIGGGPNLEIGYIWAVAV